MHVQVMFKQHDASFTLAVRFRHFWHSLYIILHSVFTWDEPIKLETKPYITTWANIWYTSMTTTEEPNCWALYPSVEYIWPQMIPTFGASVIIITRITNSLAIKRHRFWPLSWTPDTRQTHLWNCSLTSICYQKPTILFAPWAPTWVQFTFEIVIPDRWEIRYRVQVFCAHSGCFYGRYKVKSFRNKRNSI